MATSCVFIRMSETQDKVVKLKLWISKSTTYLCRENRKIKNSIEIKDLIFKLLSLNQKESGVESLPFIKHMVRYDTQTQPVFYQSAVQRVRAMKNVTI